MPFACCPILNSPFSSLDSLFCCLFSFKRLFNLNELCVSIKMQRLRYEAQRANRFAPPAQAPSLLPLSLSPLCVSSELAGQVELSLRMLRYKMHLQPRVSVRLTCPVNPLLASLSLSLFFSHSLVDFLCLPYDKFAHCSAELMMSFCLVFCFGCQPPRRIRHQGSTGYKGRGYRVLVTRPQTAQAQILICACSTSVKHVSQSRSPPNESRDDDAYRDRL